MKLTSSFMMIIILIVFSKSKITSILKIISIFNGFYSQPHILRMKIKVNMSKFSKEWSKSWIKPNKLECKLNS